MDWYLKNEQLSPAAIVGGLFIVAAFALLSWSTYREMDEERRKRCVFFEFWLLFSVLLSAFLLLLPPKVFFFIYTRSGAGAEDLADSWLAFLRLESEIVDSDSED